MLNRLCMYFLPPKDVGGAPTSEHEARTDRQPFLPCSYVKSLVRGMCPPNSDIILSCECLCFATHITFRPARTVEEAQNMEEPCIA